MCATGFVQLNYVTELPISTFESLVCRYLMEIFHFIVTHQMTKNVIFCIEKSFLYMFIINEKIQIYHTSPSSDNFVP
jgi:hypothetical protein